MQTRTVLRVLVPMIAIAVGAAGSEAMLRIAGHHPWSAARIDRDEPTMHEPDAVLGWRNRAGIYRVPPYESGSGPIEVTFLADGTRRTAIATGSRARDGLLLIGDSVTQGWAISDSDTFAWKLQAEFPSLNVVNLGTGGFSSYQSLLMLERALPRWERARLVLYGFNDFHEDRNVAADFWLESLLKLTRRGHADLPFATLDASGGLVRHSPARYVALPFRESLAIVPLLERTYMRIRTRNRTAQKRPVTERILVEMNRAAGAHAAAFAVVLLSLKAEARAHYTRFLAAHHITGIDCAFDLTDDMRVPGEGHPNGAMNTRWAACISRSIAPGLEPADPSGTTTGAAH